MEPLSAADLGIVARTRWVSNSISYSFYLNSPPQYWTNLRLGGLFGSDRDKTSAVTAKQCSAFEASVGAWSAAANIFLQETAGGVGDIFVGRIPFDSGDGVDVGPDAQAATLPLGGDPNRMGDIWLSTRPGMAESRMDPGEVGFFNVLHELGHALGLRGDSNLNGYSWKSLRYTVMSYQGLDNKQINMQHDSFR